ncbi:MAG: DUF1614 domain-containing protein, partial [Methanophagales archaeon]|nr:DUF1614 domain-containing protein [Methanophagales archaeon]
FVFFIVILAMLITSVIELPIPILGQTVRTKKPDYSDREARAIGEIYGVSILEEMHAGSDKRYKTRITVNMGGVIIPLFYALYLLLFFNQDQMNGYTYTYTYTLPLLEITMATLLMTLISYMVSEVKGGVGILVPNYVGLFAIPIGPILAPPGLPIDQIAMVLIFVPAIFGILIGMLVRLITLRKEEVGSAFFNIGGTGSFYTVYLISFLTLMIANLI